MKTKTILTLLMCLGSLLSKAQTSDQTVISLRSINTVVLNEAGAACKIFPSASNEIVVQSELHTRGRIWGWSFPKERPVFKITHRLSGDTLYISMPQTFNFKTVGISTYTEQITGIIQMPADKRLVIQSSRLGKKI